MRVSCAQTSSGSEILITLIDEPGEVNEVRATWAIDDGLSTTIRLKTVNSTVDSGVFVEGDDTIGFVDIVWIRGVDAPGGQPGHRQLGHLTIIGAGPDNGDMLVLLSRQLGCISNAAWFDASGPWGGGLPRGNCASSAMLEHGLTIGRSSIDDWDGMLVRRLGSTWIKAAIRGNLTGTIERGQQGWLAVALGVRESPSTSWAGTARVTAPIECDQLQALFVGHELSADVDIDETLVGPVIIGADGDERNTWDSGATITVGSGGSPDLVVSGASMSYTGDAADFGGGSVTFADHDTDCTSGSTAYGVQRTEPAYSERRTYVSPFGGGCVPAYVIDVSTPPTELVVHHYGPLFRHALLSCTGCCSGADASHAADFYAVYRRRARTVDTGFDETGWHPDAYTDSGGPNTHWDVDDFAFYDRDLGSHWELVTDDFEVRAADAATLVSNLERTYTIRPVAGSFEAGYEYVFASNNYGSLCPAVVHASYSHCLAKAGSGPPESLNGYFIALTVQDACTGDVNMDGVVDNDDLSAVLLQAGAVDGVANGGQWDWVVDASGDWGTVDGLDAAEVMANFGSCN